MSNLLSIKYVPSSALLPETLVQGRLYFVGDEQVIILDSGDGPKIYGATSSPATFLTAETSPSLKEQIDILAAAELQTGLNYWAETVKVRKELSRLEARLETLTAKLQAQASSNAAGILQLTQAFNAEAEKTESEIATLAKTITKFHPYFDPETQTYNPDTDDPLDNETISTDAGQWIIQQTYNPDGTMTLELTPLAQYVETLKEGDIVMIDGEQWEVHEITNEDGTISLRLVPKSE